MKKLLTILLLLAIVTSLFAQSKEDIQRLEEFKKKVNAPVVLTARSTGKVVVKKDIRYNLKDTSTKRMDVYLPDDKKPMPLVILVHGKTPFETNPKNWGVYESWGNLLAGEGFVAVTFTHSLAIPGKSLEDASLDLEAAITYLKSHCRDFAIDSSKIALVAFSAGSPLVTYPFTREDKNIKALVSFYGFLTIADTKLFGTVSTATVSKFSLINFIDTNARYFPPVFITQAGKEINPGLNQSINSFVTKASLNNIPVTFFNHPLGVHGFDNQNDDARSREIIQSMLNFLHTHVN